MDESLHIPDQHKGDDYLQNLVSRVRNNEINSMTSEEVDALDDAIELGLVNEEELRVTEQNNAT